jgi:hypothetical protein
MRNVAGIQGRIAANAEVRLRDQRSLQWVSVFCLVLLVSGCALLHAPAETSPSLHAELSEPLAGEALAMRRVDLERAWRDMVSFQLTLRGILDRNDRRGSGVLDDFLARYMGEHLDPLLLSGWQSSHPELAAIDASLRLIKAEMLIDMRSPKQVQHTLDEIVKRFVGRGELLVEYPVGDQRTLLEALDHLGGVDWNRRTIGTCEEKPSLEACLRAAF